MEDFEENLTRFIRPDIAREHGEFARVAQKFGIEESVLNFLAEQGRLVELSDAVWSELDNTDSYKFGVDDWDEVQRWSDEYGRNWEDLKTKVASGKGVDAPIMMRFGDTYHLVSGNTRLMVARAMGIKPLVWEFEVDLHGN